MLFRDFVYFVDRFLANGNKAIHELHESAPAQGLPTLHKEHEES